MNTEADTTIDLDEYFASKGKENASNSAGSHQPSFVPSKGGDYSQDLTNEELTTILKNI